ncbi:MAG TPA: hypothetical protein VHC42_05915 [Rhizomicrobium sp.]|nr:hypothetical protein [Rhizomicrobium sp.]
MSEASSHSNVPGPRSPVGLAPLFFGMIAAPILWIGHLWLSYAISSELCFPGPEPLSLRLDPSVAGTLRPLLIAFDAAALVIAAAGGIVAWRCWTASRGEGRDWITDAFGIGVGRSRFMSVWGMLSSAIFFGALVFATIASLATPLCAP